MPQILKMYDGISKAMQSTPDYSLHIKAHKNFKIAAANFRGGKK